MSVRVALVGLGEIGVGAHLPALLAHPEVDLVALADPDPVRRQHVATLTRVPTVAGLDEVLAADPAMDTAAMVLATPPWVTPDLTVRALRAGRHVLAEKPVATSTEAAAAYDVLTDDERGRLQVGLTYRHDPALEQLRDWLADGVLGHPLLVRAHIYDERRDPADPAHERRLRDTLRHGTPVAHEGAHVLDWLSYLLGGPPAGVADAWALRTDDTFAAPNLTGARLSYPDGSVALVEFGWLTDALPRCEISVLGPAGHVLLDGFTFRLTLSTSDGAKVVDLPGDRTTRSFERQLTRFVELIAGRRERPSPDLADGIAALALGERIAHAAVGSA